MLGASRASLAAVREVLANGAVDRALGEELLSVASVLGGEPTLRGALSDPGSPEAVRAGIAGSVLDGKVGARTLEVVVATVSARWSSGRDLVEALGSLGAEALLAAAEADGRIDSVQNELFAFSRTVAANGELQLVLGDPAVPADQRAAVVDQLVGGRVEPETAILLRDAVTQQRGRRLDDILDDLVELAAVRREELLATVRTAIAMDGGQQERLSAVLTRIYGRTVRLQNVVDPQVVGGVSVTIDDEVIDGTVAHRLDQARRLLVGGAG